MELVHPGLPTMLLLEVAGEGCRWSWFCCAGGPVAEDFLRSFPALSSRITAGKHLGLNSEAAKCFEHLLDAQIVLLGCALAELRGSAF